MFKKLCEKRKEKQEKEITLFIILFAFLGMIIKFQEAENMKKSYIERDLARKNSYRKAIKLWLKDQSNYNNKVIDKISAYVTRRGQARPLYMKH